MRGLKIAAIILFAIGLLLAGGATLLLINKMNFIDRAEITEGIVTNLAAKQSDNGLTYAPVYTYTIDDKPYSAQSSTSSNPASYDIGEKIEVLYDPADPSDATINGTASLYLGSIILYILGGFFALVGLIIGLITLIAGRKRKRLTETGKQTAVQVVKLEENTSVSINNKHPLRIIGKGLNPVTQQLETFVSSNLYTYPAAFESGAWVLAFVDPDKPTKHHIELQRPEEALIVEASVAMPTQTNQPLPETAAPESPYTAK